MNCNAKRLASLCCSAALLMGLWGCGWDSAPKNTDQIQNSEGAQGSEGTSNSGSSSAGNGSAISQITPVDPKTLFSDRDKDPGYDETASCHIRLSDAGSTSDSSNAAIDGNIITIKAEGTYILSGSLTDGQLVVDADTAKVQLVLDNASITKNTSASIYVKQADKVFVTLAENSANTISSTGEFIAIDENNIDAAIFSKDDLTLNGSGTLTVSCETGHGIVSKDELVITGGTYQVNASGHCLSGKDCVSILDGSFTLQAGKDGIHSENADDTAKGNIYIVAGTYGITSDGDGVDASGTLTVTGGDYTFTTGGGNANGPVHTDREMGGFGGKGGMRDFGEKGDFGGRGRFGDDAGMFEAPNDPNGQLPPDESADSVSSKGVKADASLYLGGGTFVFDCADDAVHSGGELLVNSGSYTIATGDDGMHADTSLLIHDGTINITTSYEGLEGQKITINGGSIRVVSSDDGFNAAGDSSDISLVINGGTIYVNADGDGLDSNNTLTINGGEIYVSGSTSNDNAALDWENTGSINGGTIFAAGSSGMMENFRSASQGSILTSFQTSVNGEITVTDADRNAILSFTPEKSCNSILVSSPLLTQGSTYTITGGDQTVTIELTDLIYGAGSGMGGFGHTFRPK